MVNGPTDEVPRAKRLKLLREAKERKERLEKGEVTVESNDADDSIIDRSENDDHNNTSNDLVKTATTSDPIVEEEDVVNLAPKRANWDIERDIAPMLKKLERRTQHAIVDIVREKIAMEQFDAEEEEED